MTLQKLTAGLLLATAACINAAMASAQPELRALTGSAPYICTYVWDDPLEIPPLPQPDDVPVETLAPLPAGLPSRAEPLPPRPPRIDDPTVLTWQQFPITAVAYSPDDQYIVTGTAYGLLQLWTRQGEPIGFPFGSGEATHIELVGFSADGETIVVGDRRGWLRQWDLAGQLLSEVDTQAHEYAALAWDISPEHTRVVVGSLQGDVQLWTVGEGRARRLAMTEVDDSVYAISFSPHANSLPRDIAVGLRQGNVTFLDYQLEPSREDLQIVADTVTGLSWYPGTRILAVRDRQGVIRVVDATDAPFTPALLDMSRRTSRPPFGYSPTGQLVSLAAAVDWRLPPVLTSWNLQQRVTNNPIERGNPTAFAFDTSGNLAVGNGDCTLRLWDRDLQPLTVPFSRPEVEVATVGISGFDGQRFVQWSITTDPTRRGPFGVPIPTAYRLNQWAVDGTLLDTAALASVDAVRDAVVDMAGQQFITLGSYGRVRRWGFDGTLLGEFEVEGRPRALALHPDGEKVAIATNDDKPTVTLWSLNGQQIRTLLTLDDNDYIYTLALDPQGEGVAVGIDDDSDDLEKILFLSLTGEPNTTPIVLNQAGHFTLAFSPDGRLLAAGDSDGAISVWRRDGSSVSQFTLPETGPRIISLAFSPDNSLLVSVDTDEAVRLWKVDGTHLGNIWPDETVRLNDVRFSPDGQALLIGSEKGIHRWWLPPVLTGQRTMPFLAVTPLVLQSPFAPPPPPSDVIDVDDAASSAPDPAPGYEARPFPSLP